jgi:hypothetical protein
MSVEVSTLKPNGVTEFSSRQTLSNEIRPFQQHFLKAYFLWKFSVKAILIIGRGDP